MNHFDAAQLIDPFFLEETYATAYYQYQNGNYSKAMDLFRFLTLSDSGSRRNWIGLGAAQQMLKEYDAAIQSFVFAALMDNKDPYVYFYLAQCLFAKGEISLGLWTLGALERAAENQIKYKNLLGQADLLRQTWSKAASTQAKE